MTFDRMGEAMQTRETEAKRVEEALETRYQGLLTLKEISQAILSSLDLKAVLESILDKAVLSGSFDMGSIRLLIRSGEILEVVASRGYRDLENIQMHRGVASSKPSGQLMLREMLCNETRVEENVPECDGLRTLKREGVHSAIIIPVHAKEDVLGIIQLGSRTPRKFQPEEVHLLEAIGSQVGIAAQKAQLYEQTKKQAIELEKAKRVKDEFLGFVSRELRTPLNVVMGYTGMVKDGMLGKINQEQEQALGKVIRQSNNFLAMINGILQATRLEADEVKVESDVVSLRDLLEGLKYVYDLTMDKELTLNWDYAPDLPVVKADSEKLRQILQNLINNAIKFTEKGSVTISARYFAGAKAVELKVMDTGIGITEEMMPVIFERFRQVDSSESRGYGGVGLGLYTVKKFTELLGGKIHVESEPDKGSTFSVTIPCESSLSGGSSQHREQIDRTQTTPL